MTACRKPVVLGGTPLFSQMLDVVGPALPPLEAIAGRISDALATGRLTNNGVYVRQFAHESLRSSRRVRPPRRVGLGW